MNRSLFVSAIVFALGSLSAYAGTATWTGSTSSPGTWVTGSNWSGASGGNGTAPTSSDDVILDNSSVTLPSTIALGGSAFANSLTIGSASGLSSGTGTFTLEANSTGGTGETLAITSGDITVASGANEPISIISNGTQGPFTLSTTASGFTIANNSAQTLSIAGKLIGTSTTLTVNGTGSGVVVLTGANTYTGLTQLDGSILNVSGTLTAGAGGTAGPLGESSNVAGNLIFGGGTLQDTSNGGTTTTDRLFTIGDSNGNTATLDNSSGQNFTFTNTGSILFQNAATHTLTLTGTTGNPSSPTRYGELVPILGDDGAYATSLVKTGTGQWYLYGLNTYSGGTTIKAGTLIAYVSSSGSAGAFGTGTITLGDSSGSANSYLYATAGITVSNAVTVAAGSSGTLTLGSNNTATSGETFSGAITLDNNLTVYQASGQALTLSGATISSGASGTQTLTFNTQTTSSPKMSVSNAIGGGSGTIAVVIAGAAESNSTYGVVFTGNNTYTGGTTINTGALTIGTGGTLGASTSSLTVNNTNTTVAGNAVYLNLATGTNTIVGSLSGALSTPSSGTNTATITNGGTGTNFTVNQTSNGTYAGIIAGTGTFTLGSSSNATLTFTGANTYSGGTTVAGGTLLVDNTSGSGTGTKAVSVASGGTLGGTGTINTSTAVTSGVAVDIASGGTLSPSGGTTTGFSHLALTLHSGSTATLESGAKLTFNLGTSTAGSDEVVVTGGQLSVNGQQFGDFTFNVLSGTTIANPTTYILIDSSALGSIGTGLGATTSGTFDGGLYNGQLSLSGGDLDLTVTPNAVPEPSTWALMLGGLFFFAAFQARRRTA